MLHITWSKAAVVALLQDAPFCWIDSRRPATITHLTLESA